MRRKIRPGVCAGPGGGGLPKRLVVSSWENLCVRLHSEPRDEDYLMSLVRIDGCWRISEIIPARLCGSL